MKTAMKLPLPSKQYIRDSHWIVQHYAELSVQYPNKWVAVHKGRVVAVGENSGSTKKLAQRRTGFLDIPVQLVDDGTIIY